MKEFNQLHIITSGKISIDDLKEAIKKIILDKISLYRYFILQQEEKTNPFEARRVITDSKVISWMLYGTNNIDELLNLIGEIGVSFYKVNIVNMETSIIELNAKDVAIEKVYGMGENERKDLLGKLLTESILSRKTQPNNSFPDQTKWKPVPKEEMDAYEKAIRNSRRQSSCSGAFHRDVCSLIERLINEENYAYQFYVVTITEEPPEGVMGGTTYWEIEGHTSEDLQRLTFRKNDYLFMVDEEGAKEV